MKTQITPLSQDGREGLWCSAVETIGVGWSGAVGRKVPESVGEKAIVSTVLIGRVNQDANVLVNSPINTRRF
jgi:hypothetical protein